MDQERADWSVSLGDLRIPFFRCTPRPFWIWRRYLLRLFGAQIGQNVHVYPTAHIAVPWNLSIEDDASVGDGAILYSLGKIHIGRAASISQYAHLCAGTHDYRTRDLALVKAPIKIGPGAWICADSFVGPGVIVGELAIVGARSVLVRDAPPNTILGGNPARILRARPSFES